MASPELAPLAPEAPPLLPPSALPLVPLVPLVPPLAEASPLLLEPASLGDPASAAVTVIARVVVDTASPPVPAPLAAIPATYIVTAPGTLGATNENL